MGWAQVADVERRINETISQKSEEIKNCIYKKIDENIRLIPSVSAQDDIVTKGIGYSVKFKRSGIVTLYLTANTSHTSTSHTVSVEYKKNGETAKNLSVTIDRGFSGDTASTNIEVSRGDIIEVKPKVTSVYVDLKFSLRAKIELKNGIAEEI